jgi:hypothetical protein
MIPEYEGIDGAVKKGCQSGRIRNTSILVNKYETKISVSSFIGNLTDALIKIDQISQIVTVWIRYIEKGSCGFGASNNRADTLPAEHSHQVESDAGLYRNLGAAHDEECHFSRGHIEGNHDHQPSVVFVGREIFL